MIEICNFCKERHDTGNDDNLTYNGIVVKTCPKIPVNMVVPPDWQDRWKTSIECGYDPKRQIMTWDAPMWHCEYNVATTERLELINRNTTLLCLR